MKYRKQRTNNHGNVVVPRPFVFVFPCVISSHSFISLRGIWINLYLLIYFLFYKYWLQQYSIRSQRLQTGCNRFSVHIIYYKSNTTSNEFVLKTTYMFTLFVSEIHLYFIHYLLEVGWVLGLRFPGIVSLFHCRLLFVLFNMPQIHKIKLNPIHVFVSLPLGNQSQKHHLNLEILLAQEIDQKSSVIGNDQSQTTLGSYVKNTITV